MSSYEALAIIARPPVSAPKPMATELSLALVFDPIAIEFVFCAMAL